jgi:hypothetical protein
MLAIILGGLEYRGRHLIRPLKTETSHACEYPSAETLHAWNDTFGPLNEGIDAHVACIPLGRNGTTVRLCGRGLR